MTISADTDARYLTPANGFDEMAHTYDARLAGNPVLGVESEAVLNALRGLPARSRIVDVACGTGRYALELARHVEAEVSGVDLSPAMLGLATRKARRAEVPVRWHVGDLTSGHLPIADGTADIALCALALSFVPDLSPAFASLARLLRPGGRLVISDHHPFGLCAAHAASRARFASDRAPYVRFTSSAGEECRIAQHIHTVADLFHAARDAGLETEQIAEPLVSHELARDYGGPLRDRIGTPLAIVMRFVRTSG